MEPEPYLKLQKMWKKFVVSKSRGLFRFQNQGRKGMSKSVQAIHFPPRTRRKYNLKSPN